MYKTCMFGGVTKCVLLGCLTVKAVRDCDVAGKVSI